MGYIIIGLVVVGLGPTLLVPFLKKHEACQLEQKEVK